MKTRTLLLLSVGTALAILLAGGVLLVQLSGQEDTVQPSLIGSEVVIGDLTMTVVAAEEAGTAADATYSVDVVLSGVADGVDSIRLVTGDGRLEPAVAPADGRCVELTVAEQRCRLDFDVSLVESSNRTLVVRRGDDQANWNLAS